MYYLITQRESVRFGYGYAFPMSGINAGNLTMTPRFEDRDLYEVVTRVQVDCIKQLCVIPHFLKWELPENSDIVTFKWMVDGQGPAIAFAMLVDGSVEEIGEISTYGK